MERFCVSYVSEWNPWRWWMQLINLKFINPIKVQTDFYKFVNIYSKACWREASQQHGAARTMTTSHEAENSKAFGSSYGMHISLISAILQSCHFLRDNTSCKPHKKRVCIRCPCYWCEKVRGYESERVHFIYQQAKAKAFKTCQSTTLMI